LLILKEIVFTADFIHIIRFVVFSWGSSRRAPMGAFQVDTLAFYFLFLVIALCYFIW